MIQKAKRQIRTRTRSKKIRVSIADNTTTATICEPHHEHHQCIEFDFPHQRKDWWHQWERPRLWGTWNWSYLRKTGILQSEDQIPKQPLWKEQTYSTTKWNIWKKTLLGDNQTNGRKHIHTQNNEWMLTQSEKRRRWTQIHVPNERPEEVKPSWENVIIKSCFSLMKTLLDSISARKDLCRSNLPKIETIVLKMFIFKWKKQRET